MLGETITPFFHCPFQFIITVKTVLSMCMSIGFLLSSENDV